MIASMLYVIGGVSILSGVFLWMNGQPLYFLLAGVVSGFLFLGFAKVISLLTEIKNELVPEKQEVNDPVEVKDGKSNMLTSDCPACTKTLNYPSYRSSQMSKCPHCKEEIRLP